MAPLVSVITLFALLSASASAFTYTPSGTYAPSFVQCPRGDDAVTIRPATCLSEQEKEFRCKRAPNVVRLVAALGPLVTLSLGRGHGQVPQSGPNSRVVRSREIH